MVLRHLQGKVTRVPPSNRECLSFSHSLLSLSGGHWKRCVGVGLRCCASEPCAVPSIPLSLVTSTQVWFVILARVLPKSTCKQKELKNTLKVYKVTPQKYNETPLRFCKKGQFSFTFCFSDLVTIARTRSRFYN